MTRFNKPLSINGTSISYVNNGVKIYPGGGKRETRGQVNAAPTHILNIEEDFAIVKIEIENTDANLALFRQFFSNDNNNTIEYGDESFVNATLMQIPDDQATLETSEYEFHCDPIILA